MADKGSVQNACVMRIHGHTENSAVIVADPYGVAIDDDGNVYVTDCRSHLLYKFDKELNFKDKAGTGKRGQDKTTFHFPHGVAVIGGMVYVCDNGSCRVKVYGTDLVHQYSFGSRSREERFDEQTLYGPVDIAGDSKNGLYVADNKKMAVVKFRLREQGRIPPECVQNIAHKQLRMPSGLTVDSNDFIYVTDKLSNDIIVFDSNGLHIAMLNTKMMHSPRAICSEKGQGESTVLYVSDNENAVNIWKCTIKCS